MLVCGTVFSQTGPAGVGANDGSSTLDIWLRDTGHFSDLGTTVATNGNFLEQWNDASGNNNHAIQSVGSRQPQYNTNLKNGYPSLNFAGNDELRVNYNISPNVRPNITVIAVAEHNTATSTPFSKLFGHDDSGFDRSIGFDNRCGGNTFHYFGRSRVNCFTSPIANSDFVVNVEYTNNRFSGWFNGDLLINNVFNFNGNGESFLTIGGITDRNFGQTYNEFWNGTITEFIVFGGTLNETQHILISNYLAAKYDVALADNDLYVQDDPGNGNFDHDVAGIGRRTGAADQHTDAQGTGIVRMLNADDLDNNEFLLWGNNGLNLTSENTVDVPVGVTSRSNRVWRVSEVDTSNNTVDVGDVDVRFDLSGMTTSNVTAVRLLIDSDNDGVFNDETIVATATHLGSNIYEFSQVNIGNNERFTLAFNKNVTVITNRKITYRVNQ